LLELPTLNLGSFGKDGEQIKNSRVPSFSSDILSFINEIDACAVVDCTVGVPTEEKINKIHNTASYLNEKACATFIPVIISALEVPTRDSANIAKVRIVDKLEVEKILGLIGSGKVREARRLLIDNIK
jgi:hypothetical protein